MFRQLFVITFLSILTFDLQKAAAQEQPTLKAGVILSMSGGLEQWCGYIRQGIELAAGEPSPVGMQIVFEDDRSVDKKAALSAAQKLLHVDKVDLLVSWTASTEPVLGPAATSARTPLLVGAYDRNVAAGGPYVFGAFVNYDLVSREIVRFFVQKKGARKLGLVMAADDWSQNFEAPFRDEAQKLGASVLFSEVIAANERDTRSLFLKMRARNVDAVLAPLYSGSLYSFLKTAQEMHFPGLIHAGDGMFEEDLNVLGSNAEGVYANQIWLMSEKLSADFKKKFGTDTNALQIGLVASGYDWVKHVQSTAARLLKDGKSITRENLKGALRTFQSDGYLGKQMYGGPPAQSGEVIMTVKKGRFVLEQ